MIRKCSVCGVERETRSARTVYVCTDMKCVRAARPRVALHGHNIKKKRAYFKRLKRVRARNIRQGKGPDVWGY